MDAIGSDDSIFETDSRIVKGGYYYAVGNQYPYKNYRWVVEAAKYNKDAVFVVAGGKLNISEDIGLAGDNIIYVGKANKLKNRVKYINDELRRPDTVTRACQRYR